MFVLRKRKYKKQNTSHFGTGTERDYLSFKRTAACISFVVFQNGNTLV